MSSRFFVAAELEPGDQLTLVGDDAHHAARVLRLKPGATLVAVGPSGTEYAAVVETVEPAEPRLTARVAAAKRPQREPRLRVAVAQALIKGDRMDWALQKATELGATAFFPFSSARTTVRLDERRAAARVARWQRIVSGAAQQSGRLTVPPVADVTSFDTFVEQVRTWAQQHGAGSVLLASEAETEHGLFTALQSLLGPPLEGSPAAAGDPAAAQSSPSTRPLLLIVGSEGGFELHENAALAGAGATPVTVGPLILRAETAAPAILSMILYHAGDLGRGGFT